MKLYVRPVNQIYFPDRRYSNILQRLQSCLTTIRLYYNNIMLYACRVEKQIALQFTIYRYAATELRFTTVSKSHILFYIKY